MAEKCIYCPARRQYRDRGEIRGQDQDIKQRVTLAAVDPRVGKFDKGACLPFHKGRSRHPSRPAPRGEVRSIVRGSLDELNSSPE